MSRRTAVPTAALSSSATSDRAVSQTRRSLGFTRRRHATAWAIFAAVTVVFFHPVLQGETFSDVDRRQREVHPWAAFQEDRGSPLHFDHADSFHPWQVFMNQELRDGELPLWNPYSFAGHPFFANGQNGMLYPPRLAASYVVSPARVHDFLLVSHFFFAGVAMFLLLAVLRVSFLAAVFGGIAWMVNSFALAWQALDHYVAIEVGLPAGVLLAHLVVRRRSWQAALGLAGVGGLLFLGGNVLFVELALIAIYGYGLALILAGLRQGRETAMDGVARLGAAGLLSVGLGAVVILPTLVLSGESSRASLSFEELGEFALGWDDLKHVFVPPPDPFEVDPYHHALFAGSVVGVLALLGLFRRRVFPLFAALLSAFVVLFMTHSGVTNIVSQVLPGFDNFKPLTRAAFILVFALVGLAAFGLERVLGWLSTRRALAWRERLPVGISTSAVRAALVLVLAASVLVQAGRWSGYVMLHHPHRAEFLYPSTPLIDYLRRQREGRFLPTGTSFRGSTSMSHRLRSAIGYESLLPRRTQAFWRVVAEGLRPDELATERPVFAYHPALDLADVRPSLLARAGVVHVVAPPLESQQNYYRLPNGRIVMRAAGYYDPANPYATGRPQERNTEEFERWGQFDPAWEGNPSALPPKGLKLGYQGDDGRVYTVAGALPRAYVVGGCAEVAGAAAALERFAARGATSADVILERPYLRRAGLTCANPAGIDLRAAAVVEESADSLVVEADAARVGWLVVNDSWDDDWHATVDGREVEVLPANYAFRAVPIRAGTHTVRFTYEPASFRWGAVVSLASFAAIVAGFAFCLRRRFSAR